jgi:hypothetical protein
MERDLRKFAGCLPYASELYGVHQPLLGWKSRLARLRVWQGLSLPKFPRRVRAALEERGVNVQFARERGFLIDREGRLTNFRDDIDLFADQEREARFAVPEFLDSLLVRSLQESARRDLSSVPLTDNDHWSSFWREMLSKETLNKRFRNVLEELKADAFGPGARPFGEHDPLRGYVARIETLLGGMQPTADFIFNRELLIARYLNSLLPPGGENQPDFPQRINTLLLSELPQMDIESALKALDPLALTVGAGRDAVLSPLGILHIFRQYFFEFDNFLGPAVEHIWLAPGATTELIEVSTRRILVEETLERSLERIVKNEVETTTEDELSTALRSENQRDTKLGSSVSGGATILIAHAEASGSMSVEETQRAAREDNHRTKRQQSSKLASEIRSNFKSTFRTVTETTDTRSKRYVIENRVGPDGGPPAVVNYELRRKMRQIGVQTQDVGTQLCWQVFVDDPGRELGVAQLVHMASRSDLSKYAETPLKPIPGKAVETITVLLPVPRPGQRSTLGPIAASGFLGLMAGGVPGVAAGVAAFEVLDSLFGDDDDEVESYQIKPATILRQEYKLTLPTGYVIAPAGEQDKDDPSFLIEQNGEIPLKHLSNGANTKWRMQIASATDGRLLLVVHEGKVTPGEMMEFQFRVTIKPTDEAVAAVVAENAAIAKDNEARTAERQMKLKEDFISNVKDRVKLASGVKARPASELREEERTVIYRALIARLMEDAWSLTVDRKVAHLRSEFIRSIFDVDKMFYAVAPEWWQPRLHRSDQNVGGKLPEHMTKTQLKMSAVSVSVSKKFFTTEASQRRRAARAELGPLGADDVVGWGGEGRSDNYMITEDSSPARLGSSLGWLLQLDGDNLRNAFLNAPWVKAVVPIRHGREREALEWLQQAEVEGTDGLGETYAGEDLARFRERLAALGEDRNPTIGEVLTMVADDIAAKSRKAMTTVEETVQMDGESRTVRYLPPERVFEFGFDPMDRAFKPLPEPGEAFDMVDQWVEVLPTDQIGAVQVNYDPKTGRMT